MAVVRCSARQASQRTAKSLPSSVFSGIGRVLRVRHLGQVQLIWRMGFMAAAILFAAREERVNLG